MKRLDDSIKNITCSKKMIQRSIQVPEEIWEAAKCIPGGRTRYIINQLAEAVNSYKSELPKLRLEVEELQSQRYDIDAKISAKIMRIAELEAEVEVGFNEAVKQQQIIEQAITEAIRLIRSHRSDLTQYHYNRLSDLSGTPSKDIETFVKEHRYKPTEDQIREFFLR